MRTAEDVEHQAEEQGEAGGLRANADIRGDGRGRAFVHVGSPLVERHSGNFEEEAGGDGDESENDQPVDEAVSEGVAEPAVEHIADLEDVGGSAQAIEEGEAVGENAGAESAEEQILHGRFVGALVARAGNRRGRRS